MRLPITVACILLKSAWQAVFLRSALIALLLAPLATLHAAELKLAGIFTDHAVLQRDVAAPVWGWAHPNEQITVTFAGQTKTATADANGKWLVRLDPMPASAEGRELVVQSTSENRKSTNTDVVVGDVWLCSGQSNMGISMSVPGNPFLVESIAKAGNPRLRWFATLHQFPDAPVRDTQGRWEAATPETVKSFGMPGLPFIMTELAPFGQPSPQPQDSARARFGEALSRTAKADGNAWVITIVDGGDPLDIHPVKKEIPAGRFAAMALAKVYGKPNIAHGPVLNSWQATDDRAVLKFAAAGGGLVAKQVNLGGHELAADNLNGFELAGADRKFVCGEARIDGKDTVIVTSPNVQQPVAVRYAWAAFPRCNLFNSDGFAAYPFRTDDWPWQTPPDASAARPNPSPKTAQASATRIAIRDGHFVDTGTGKPFRPFGVNYYRTAPIGEEKRGHSALSPGSYDEAFITRMMETLSRDGYNTVRSFLSNHSGPNGIVTDPQSAEVNPAFLANLVHFLRTAQTHGLHVILSWDTWTPDSRAWAETPLADEARHGWVTEPSPGLKVNGFRLTPKPIRAKANAIRALIEGLRKSAPELLPVVLAWELENEVHFNLDQEPFLSRPAAFAFGGREFDLRTDDGAQALMDAAARTWASACADAIHAADPEALVSASVFTFAAVGRQGPGTWSKDQTKDMRVPARPMALLESSLDFVDIHLYAGKSKTESIAQHLQRDLASVEMSALTAEAKRLGKPILVGESGVAAHFTRRGPDWQTIHHDVGVDLLREFHQALATHPFAGVLHWHYGSPDSTAQDEYPALALFPRYGEALKSSRNAQKPSAAP